MGGEHTIIDRASGKMVVRKLHLEIGLRALQGISSKLGL